MILKGIRYTSRIFLKVWKPCDVVDLWLVLAVFFVAPTLFFFLLLPPCVIIVIFVLNFPPRHQIPGVCLPADRKTKYHAVNQGECRVLVHVFWSDRPRVDPINGESAEAFTVLNVQYVLFSILRHYSLPQTGHTMLRERPHISRSSSSHGPSRVVKAQKDEL